MQPPTSIDFMTVLAALIAVVIGPQYAPLLSAYALIVLGWGVGLFIGLIHRPPRSRVSTFAYVVVSFVVAVAMTAFIAEMLSPLGEVLKDYIRLDAKALLMPIAGAIPAVGERWGSVARWLWRKLAPAALQPAGKKDV